MECFVPGRVVVYPGPEASEHSPQSVLGDAKMPPDIEFSIRDVIDMNRIERGEVYKKLHDFPLPFVARVPEGEEQRAAEALRRARMVRSAFPDFYVRPQASLDIHDAAIQSAIARVHASPRGSTCGHNTVVAVLDSGIDGTSLVHPASLFPRQFSVDDPQKAGAVPFDTTGHGTTVARIINEIAPAARIVSIQTLTGMGTISGVIAGLYLALAQGDCDVINMSLSIDCTPGICENCHRPVDAGINAKQLEYFFSDFAARCATGGHGAVLVAAGGNNRPHLAMPASFASVIAVGGYDFERREVSSFSQYSHVPAERYILAPGGENDPNGSFASVPSMRGKKNYCGTSFAAAFVSGVIARLACGRKGGPCGGGMDQGRHDALRMDDVLTLLAERAVRGFGGYDNEIHGLGLLDYRP